jgi:hypothetical protein
MHSDPMPPAAASQDPDTLPDPAAESPARSARPGRPSRGTRVTLGLVRLIALGGVLAFAVVVAAILVSQDVQGWIVGLVVGLGVELLTGFVLFSKRFSTMDRAAPPRRAAGS